SDGGRSSRELHGLDDCPTATTNGWPADRNLPHCKRTEPPARVVHFTCRRRAFHVTRAGSSGDDQAGYWSGGVTSIVRPKLVISGSRRLIRQHDDAVGPRYCRDEFQVCRLAVAKEQLAAAHKNGLNGKSKLIKQLMFEQRLPEEAVPVYDQILA